MDVHNQFNILEYSKIDSYRFGLVIYRMQAQELDVPYLIKTILDNKIDTAIVRIPATKLNQIGRLERTSMPFIVADSLVYYHADLHKIPVRTYVNEDINFTLATPEDHELLNHLVLETFGNYVNHYRNNPFFDNMHVNEGYQDWVRSYAEGHEERLCWIVRRGERPVGFGTFNFQKENKARGILYGVIPSERGKEVFRDIIRHGMNEAKARGIDNFQATGQLENIAAHRVWSSEGMSIRHSFNTLHINAMLSKSVFDKFVVHFKFKTDQQPNVNKTANRQVLEQINWEFDTRQNIVTHNHHFVNLLPFKPDLEYRFCYSFPTGSKGLLRITDEQEKVYALVYFDLKHFLA